MGEQIDIYINNYILALKNRESHRLEHLQTLLEINKKSSEDKLTLLKNLTEKAELTKEEYNLLLQDLIDIFERKIPKEVPKTPDLQLETVLYIYYFINKLYESLWRVKNVKEFLEDLIRNITLIPFIRDVTIVGDYRILGDFCVKESSFTDWLAKYLVMEQPQGVQLLRSEEVPDYLRDPFKREKCQVLIIPIEIFEKNIYLAFCCSPRDYTEWEKILLFEDLPSNLSLMLKLVYKKEEEGVFFDSVTGLPRQTYFLFQVERLFERAKDNSQNILIGIVDVDKFTAINQVFGYDVGDEVLVELSHRLKTYLQNGEIGRGRGSSFIFAIHTDTPYELLKSLQLELIKPIHTSKGEIELTLSIGGSLYPSDGDDPKVLLRFAESALKEGKKLGGNTISLFKKEIHVRASEYLTLVPKLKKALSDREFVLYCQPRISLKEKKVIGGEILVRWFHPTEGLIPPGKFIWVMEESGLIKDLGFWILEETCRLISSLPPNLYLALDLSMNLSPQQLKESDLINKIGKIFDYYHVCPKNLTIEITENIFVDDTPEMIEQINKLHELGLKIALDDFGTGYSSFRYFSMLPFHDLKIDLIFVKNMLNSPQDMEIVKTIVSLGKVLHKKVVAEGVETYEQLRELIALGVDEAQGYYFSPPIPWEKFIEFTESFDPSRYFKE